MLKNISRLEHKIGDKLYHFTCDFDSSLGDVKIALCEFIKYIGQIEDRIKEEHAKRLAEEQSKCQEGETCPPL